MLKSRGKTAVFWYEPMGKYPDGVIVTTWRGGHTPKTVANTTGDKVDVICAPNGKCYFDYPQLPGDCPPASRTRLDARQHAGKRVLPGTRARPLRQGNGTCARRRLLPVGGTSPNIERVFYQAYPRALALVETAWSSKEMKT